MNTDTDKLLCFVVMGYGKKADPGTGRMIDLNETYKKIIKPVVEERGIRCIRSDDLCAPGSIERDMLALIFGADLVIADISTFNPNAVYELGIRHALKPYSTIILLERDFSLPLPVKKTEVNLDLTDHAKVSNKTGDEQNDKNKEKSTNKKTLKGIIPFDFYDDRIIFYKHQGPEIKDRECYYAKEQLRRYLGEAEGTIKALKERQAQVLFVPEPEPVPEPVPKSGFWSCLSRLFKCEKTQRENTSLPREQTEPRVLTSSPWEKADFDSPLYTILSDVLPPEPDKLVKDIVQKWLNPKDPGGGALSLAEKAEALRAAGDFASAAALWEQLLKLRPAETYILQQLALCTYKAQQPPTRAALKRAREILESIKYQRNSETQGLLGAVYKHLSELEHNDDDADSEPASSDGDKQNIDKAILHFQCGWANNYQSYYCLENYANCQVMKALWSEELETALGLFDQAELNYRRLISLVEPQLIKDRLEYENEEPFDLTGKYSALAQSYFYLCEDRQSKTYTELFLKLPNEPWLRDTFFETRSYLTRARDVREELRAQVRGSTEDYTQILNRYPRLSTEEIEHSLRPALDTESEQQGFERTDTQDYQDNSPATYEQASFGATEQNIQKVKSLLGLTESTEQEQDPSSEQTREDLNQDKVSQHKKNQPTQQQDGSYHR